MKKYTYITISDQERTALEVAIYNLKSNTSSLSSVIKILDQLLKRSKHKEVPNVKMQTLPKNN